MSLYQVKHRLRINNEVHPAGKNISLTDEQALPLLNMGAVVKLLEAITPPSLPPSSLPITSSVSAPVARAGLPAAIAPQPADTTLAAAITTRLADEITPAPTPVVTLATEKSVTQKVAEPVAASADEPVAQTVATPLSETAPEPLSTDMPSNDNNPYGKLTKAELNAELDKRGIAHDAKAINADLEALLVADDSKKTQTADSTVK